MSIEKTAISKELKQKAIKMRNDRFLDLNDMERLSKRVGESKAQETLAKKYVHAQQRSMGNKVYGKGGFGKTLNRSMKVMDVAEKAKKYAKPAAGIAAAAGLAEVARRQYNKRKNK